MNIQVGQTVTHKSATCGTFIGKIQNFENGKYPIYFKGDKCEFTQFFTRQELLNWIADKIFTIK